MELTIYQVDAFTSRLFGGNPAAIVPLEQWLPDELMQNIAAENNLAETAFFVPSGNRYMLRWFTPTLEIDLCGHATLATGFVVFRHLHPDWQEVAFDTAKAGELKVKRLPDGLLSMDFPARPPEPGAVDSRLKGALGGHPEKVMAARDYLVTYETEDELRALKPNMHELAKVDRFVIATAPGKNCDFVSRFFAPKAGIDEDPVTGSAHSTLIPYWAERLGKTKLHAFQVSPRVGELFCEHLGSRVIMAGHAVEYLRGTIFV